MIKKILIKPDILKEKQIISIGLNKIPLPSDFRKLKEFSLLLKPGSFGGNHKHSRTEIFISWDKLTLIWQDKKGGIKKEKMGLTKDNKLTIFIISSKTPHAVVNKTDKNATLIEFADGKLNDVEETKLV